VAVTEYLEEIKLNKKPKTHTSLTRKFAAFLRDAKDQSPRSVYNKFESVMTVLKAQKMRDLIGKNDRLWLNEEHKSLRPTSSSRTKPRTRSVPRLMPFDLM